MFGIKGRDTFNKPVSDFGQIMRKMYAWWVKIFPYVLLVLFLCIIIILGRVWHKYLHTRGATEEEKQQYILKKKKETTFKKKQFEELQSAINLREENFNAERKEYHDIFYGKQQKQEKESEEEITTKEADILQNSDTAQSI